MSQTLQNQLLLSKSMNGIIEFNDGQGTTISNGQVNSNGINTNNVNTSTITTSSLAVPSLTLTDLTVTGTANLSTAQTTVETMGVGVASTRAASTAFVNNYYNNRLTTTNTWSGQNTFSKLTYSNIQSNITINNYRFDTPNVAGALVLQYSGSGTYTGIPNWTFTGTSYQVFVSGELYNGSFYFTYIPLGLQTSIILPNPADVTATTSNYSLLPGVYAFTFFAQNQGGGTIQPSVINASTSTIIASLPAVSPSPAYPEWVKYTITFQILTTTTVYFQFITSINYVCLTALSLILENAMVITDGVRTSQIGGSLSLLNGVSVENGMSVSSGLSVIGGLTSGTVTGYNNTTLNTNMGLITGTFPSNCVALGSSALTFANLTANCVAIGSSANVNGSQNEVVSIGYKSALNAGTGDVLIGSYTSSNPVIDGRNVLIGLDIGGASTMSGNSAVGDRNVIIGAGGYQYYNGFALYGACYNAVIGYYACRNNCDWFNCALGAFCLQNITGNNSGVGDTKYNVALGYNSGSTYNGLNGCSFLGALSDTTVANLTNATAIGYNCKVGASNTIQLGSNSEAVNITGQINIKQDANQRILFNDSVISKYVIRFNNANQSIGIGLDTLLNENNSGVRYNTAFGANALKTLILGRYNTAIGVDALTALTGQSFSQNVAVGYRSLVAATNCTDCVAVGVTTGGQVLTGSRNTFLGTGTNFSSATQHNDSTALGYGALITASNQIVLGRSTETVNILGTLQVQNNFINSASPTIITTTTTLSGVLFRYYSVTSAAAYSITLPAAAVGYLGCNVTFRRVGVTIANAVTSASANIFPLNSITAANTLLAANTCQVTICCMVTSATPTYGWVVIA